MDTNSGPRLPNRPTHQWNLLLVGVAQMSLRGVNRVAGSPELVRCEAGTEGKGYRCGCEYVFECDVGEYGCGRERESEWRADGARAKVMKGDARH